MSEERKIEVIEINPQVGEHYFHKTHGEMTGVVEQIDDNNQHFHVLMNFSTPKNFDKIWTPVSDLSTKPFAPIKQKKAEKKQRVSDDESAQ